MSLITNISQLRAASSISISNTLANWQPYLDEAEETFIPAKAFKEASEEYLKINLGPKYAEWQPAFDKFNSHYEDIKEGDYYDLIYDPKTGLQLNLNNKPLTALNDPLVSLAYLNIWFGKEPFSEELKDSLLKILD